MRSVVGIVIFRLENVNVINSANRIENPQCHIVLTASMYQELHIYIHGHCMFFLSSDVRDMDSFSFDDPILLIFRRDVKTMLHLRKNIVDAAKREECASQVLFLVNACN